MNFDGIKLPCWWSRGAAIDDTGDEDRGEEVACCSVGGRTWSVGESGGSLAHGEARNIMLPSSLTASVPSWNL
jgi:hypothetical protein